tara:strand:+ start:1101 stop:2486 length:1386 start_codon:yes stop_codon:yes gene_type:complete
MNSQPLVTVYIPSRNYSKFLDNAIQSVINQIYTNWELFIIDEGSKDETESIAKKYTSKYPNKIYFIKNKTPIGLQKVANHILGISNGKYMIRLDADDWFSEVALITLVNKIELTDNASIVYGNYFYTDSNGEILGVETRNKFGKEDKHGQIPPHGACTLFETRSLKSNGGYIETVNAQDGWDLWFKLFKKVGAVNIDLPVFYYRQHQLSLSKDENRLLRAREKIFEKLASKLKGDYSPSVVAVIPVKESYPKFPKVPFRKFNGKSILSIAINNALKSDKINELVVYSESKNVLKYSEELEKKKIVPKHLRLLRKKTSAQNNIPVTDFMKTAGDLFFKKNGKYPDIIIYLSLHAVNRRKSHIENALNVLLISESDSVVSVQEEREPMFKFGVSGLELINPGRFKNLSFDKEKLYRFNGSLIATWWDLVEQDSLFGIKTSYIEMSSKDSLQIKDSSQVDNDNN